MKTVKYYSGVKRETFHQFTSNLRTEIPFGKSYIWNLLYRKCPASRMRLPGTCHCDVTKADQ